MADTPAQNLFMMCSALNPFALTALPAGYHIRTCRRDELEVWKALQIDSPDQYDAYDPVLTEYYDRVYAPQGDAFFKRCLLLCDAQDTPVGTCFLWQAYGKVNTIHWFKVLPGQEGRGLGRALLSAVMQQAGARDYPVFLHTHPTSLRAIKLYMDFGFVFLTDAQIGCRQNDFNACLPLLQAGMPARVARGIQTAKAPGWFLQAVQSTPFSEF